MYNTLNEINNNYNLISMVISKPRRKSHPINKIAIRPVSINSKLMYQAEYHYPNKVTHLNFDIEEFTDFILSEVTTNFKQINIFTTENDIQILANKTDKAKIIKSKPTKKAINIEHNRKKQYIIADNTPCDFLIKLGVMDETGKVYQKHYSKFRQINRFLEIVSDCMAYLKKENIKIIDFGCGKSYLTFALYYYLKKQLNIDVEIVGLDLKENVINLCNKIAQELNYEGLKFQLGDIADYQDTGCDMVVTLHACDTATDYALINAVKWNTKVILSVPCCQHELFKQIDSPINNPMLKHGIIKDKFTELLTDALRGLKLESVGYDVSMIEFTSLEHTSKNIMIKGILNKNASSDYKTKALNEYQLLKKEYNVKPTIDLLK